MELYIDIETIPEIEPQESDLKAPASYKKAESITKYIQDNKTSLIEAEVKKRSLGMYSCKIVCLSYAFGEEDAVALTGTEEEILTKFQEAIKDHAGSPEGKELIGFNIKKFDAPIIYIRACKYNLRSLVSVFLYGRKTMKDIMEMGVYFKYGEYTSMDKLCEFFGMTGKDGVDGSHVYGLFKAGKINEIATYCNSDVEKTRTLYKMLNAY